MSEKVAELLYGGEAGISQAFGVFSSSEPYAFVKPVQRPFLQELAPSPGHPTFLWDLAAQTARFEPYTEVFQPFKPSSAAVAKESRRDSECGSKAKTIAGREKKLRLEIFCLKEIPGSP